MKFSRFKYLVEKKVELEAKENRTPGEQFDYNSIATEFLNSCMQGITHYFNIEVKSFEKQFLKIFSEMYGLKKGDQVFFFSRKSPETTLKDFMLYVNNGKNIKTYLLDTTSGSLTICLPLYMDTKKFDNPDGLDEGFHTDWTKLLNDYPKAYDVLWEIVENNLAHNKNERITLIQQMINKNNQEIELLRNPLLVNAKIDSLTKENEKNEKDIMDIKCGDFDIDVLMRK